MSLELPVVEESIYDHPKYYDLVFGSDCAAEVHFILESAKLYAKTSSIRRGNPPRFFEPACGTGRLIDAISRRGYEVEGLDLNASAVKYCNDRLKRRGSTATAFCADMCDFRVPRKFDVAFNTINSFRHVATEANARAHLQCMGDAVFKGGIYLLGVHLTPTLVPPSDGECWSARRGNLAVNTRMWFVDRDARKRVERFAIEFDIHKPSGSFRIRDMLVLRSYTPRQMNRLIDSSGCWDVIETFDFGYNIEDPIEVDGATEDVVYVLKRR